MASSATKNRLAELQRLDYLLRFKWDCGNKGCDGKPHDGLPYKHARANQLPPEGDWWAWFLMSGRGFGKTRAGAEFCKKRALEVPNSRIAIIAPDFAKGRDDCVEGDGGLRGLYDGQGCLPWEKIELWNRSIGELYLTNGSQFKIFSADDIKSADKLRGYQCSLAWFEELAMMNAQEHSWAMLEFALRLGDDPRVVITSTPRPTKLVKQLVEDPDIIVTHGSTFDNADNLPERQLRRIKARYENTTLGDQELYGKLLVESSGALWKPQHIKRDPNVPALERIVVAVDPAGSHKAESDETGIIAVGLDENARVWVLADRSGRYSPEQWANTVAGLYEELQADAVIAERNYGADMVKSTLRHAYKNLPIREVHAMRGKKLRAEPVASLYERGLVRHIGAFEELEEQLLTWVPPGRFDADGDPIPPSKWSPDHLDALVYGISELSLKSTATRGLMRFYE